MADEKRCTACCGHSHELAYEHEHEREHADSCGCAGDGCGCGHEHGGTHTKNEWLALAIGVGLLIVSFFFPDGIWRALFAIGAAVVPGAKLFWKGLRAGLRLQLDELFLLTVAVIAAIVIGEYFEAALVTLLFRFGGMMEDRAIARSKREIAALTAIRPDEASVRNAQGEFTQVQAQNVPVGGIIRVRPGERIPLDCVVKEGRSTADCSAITGESIPVEVAPGTALLSGAVNGGGLLLCETTSDFHNSLASRIIKLVEESAAKKGNTEQFITRFARIYTPVVLLIAIALAVVPVLMGTMPLAQSIRPSLVFLVASCPCALVISVPLSFFAGIGAGSRRGVIIKGSKYIEQLAKVQCAVFDKTGTLTSGKLTIAEVHAVNGFTKEQVLHIASAAERDSLHPIARAIAAHHDSLPEHAAHEISDFKELSGHGVSLTLDGQAVLCGSKRFLSESGVNIDGLDGLSVYLAVDGVAAGGVEIADLLRADTPETLQRLRDAGIARTVMLTGDNPKSAEKMAKAAGVDDFRASLLPEQKVAELQKLQAQYGRTLFVGDGINDAPVLAAADVGVAMGLGTDAAIEAADVVLVSDRISALVDAVQISRRAMGIVRFNIGFALVVKFAVLCAAGVAPMWLAVFADVGVSIIAVLNAVRILAVKKR